MFQLYGALASWGDIATGEYRPSQGQPSKSAVTGLLGAALGITRADDVAQAALAKNYGTAVCIRAAGEPLRDYHTIQVPGGDAAYATRRQELLSDRLKLNTVLSQRDYRTDAYYQIAVWPVGKDVPHTLEALYNALRRPKFSLYLGRRSCPAALPLYPQRMPDVTLKQAFDSYPLDKAQPWLGLLDNGAPVAYVWEQAGLNTQETGMESSMRHVRRDQVVSRTRWQFTDRTEYYHAEFAPGGP